MSEDRSAAEVERRRPVERFMGWARLFGSLLAFLQFGVFTHYPPGVRPAGLVLAGVFTVLGAWTLRRLARPLGVEALGRMSRATLAADTLLLVAINLLLAYERDSTTRGLMFIVILEGAMKLGRRGAWSISASVLGMEAVRILLRTTVHDTGSDLAESIFFVGLSALVAAFAGKMADLASEALAHASEHADNAEVARADLAGLHRLLISGIEGITSRPAIARSIAEAAEVVGFREAAFHRVREDGRVEQVVTSRGDWDSSVVPYDHPAHHALSEPGLRPIRHQVNDDLSVAVAIPGTETGPVGVLVFSEPRSRRRADDDMLMSLARQTALVVQLGQAFAREQSIAERLQQLDRIKNDFIMVASHELRTPLAAISGAAETLVHRRAILTEAEAQQMDRIILRQSGRLTSLVDDLNTVLDIDNGQLRVIRRATRLLPIVLSAVERADVAVELLDVEGRTVIADPHRLEQVLTQLIGNAAEHAPGAPVRIAARQQDDQLVLSVQDDGPGIDERDASRIFDRFFQSVDALAHQRGTGLGLPIARDLARAMSGDVTHVRSGTGTTFEVRLPAALPESRPRDRETTSEA